MEILFVLFVASIAVAIASIWWQSDKSQIIVQEWAQQNGFRLLESKFSLSKGPFLWTSSKRQTVYRVRVEDKSGRVRGGWVKCGSYWWGLMSDEAQVRWDDEPGAVR